MSDKKEAHYRKLIRHSDIQPSEFLMLGNSIKSDLLTVLDTYGHGILKPYHTTWEHEQVEHHVAHEKFRHTHKMVDTLPWLIEFKIGIIMFLVTFCMIENY